MTDVIVQRSRWLRGDIKTSLLRDGSGQMCCLGFACLALGINKNEIFGRLTPAEIAESSGPNSFTTTRLRDALLVDADPYNIFVNAGTTRRLMVTNDAPVGQFSADTEREEYIIREGAKIGLNFSFVD